MLPFGDFNIQMVLLNDNHEFFVHVLDLREHIDFLWKSGRNRIRIDFTPCGGFEFQVIVDKTVSSASCKA